MHDPHSFTNSGTICIEKEGFPYEFCFTSEGRKRNFSIAMEKPWNPYIRRHTALTEKVRLVKNDFVLKQNAGWGLTSKMLNKYIHHFGTESANRILEEMGIIPKEGESVDSIKLRPKIRPQCNEPNAHDAPVCIKCRFVLTYRQFAQTVEGEKKLVEEMVAKQVQEPFAG